MNKIEEIYIYIFYQQTIIWFGFVQQWREFRRLHSVEMSIFVAVNRFINIFRAPYFQTNQKVKKSEQFWRNPQYPKKQTHSTNIKNHDNPPYSFATWIYKEQPSDSATMKRKMIPIAVLLFPPAWTRGAWNTTLFATDGRFCRVFELWNGYIVILNTEVYPIVSPLNIIKPDIHWPNPNFSWFNYHFPPPNHQSTPSTNAVSAGWAFGGEGSREGSGEGTAVDCFVLQLFLNVVKTIIYHPMTMFIGGIN